MKMCRAHQATDGALLRNPDSAVLHTDGGTHFGSASPGGDDVSTVLSVLVSVCSLDPCTSRKHEYSPMCSCATR